MTSQNEMNRPKCGLKRYLCAFWFWICQLHTHHTRACKGDWRQLQIAFFNCICNAICAAQKK